MCTARLFSGNLICNRPTPHTTGHTYATSDGSSANDGHTEGGHG